MKRIKLVDIVDKEASPNRESAALDIKTDKPEITEKQDERESMRKSNSAFLPNHGSVLQGGLKYSRRLSFRNHKKTTTGSRPQTNSVQHNPNLGNPGQIKLSRNFPLQIPLHRTNK